MANHSSHPGKATGTAGWQRVVGVSSASLISSLSLVGHPSWAQAPNPDGAMADAVAAPVPAAPPDITPAPAPIAPESFPTEFSSPAIAPAPAPVVESPRPQTSEMPIATPPVITAPRSRPEPAADGYIAPNTIIFSERSTGCQATVKAGQGVNSICAPTPGSVPVAGLRGNTGELVGRVSGAGVPGLPVAGAGGLSVVSPNLNPGTTPSLRDFYRRTVRPPAALGNGNIRLIFPLSMPAPISSLFGWRMHPISGDLRFHSGTDIAAPLGTPVLAAYAGQVALADFLGGYGLAVAIDHSKGTQQTLYAHLSEVFVQSGDVVKQGDVIGRVGSTGNSTGPHLHFEFRQLTPDGWVALDAGAQLEYALAQLVNSLAIAEATSAPVKANAGAQGVVFESVRSDS